MNEISLSDDMELMKKSASAFYKRGQFEFTDHENLFFAMFPHLERQVTFGTGKGGYEAWGTKKYTADFFDRETNIVYEIDGKSHSDFSAQIVDELKKRFLLEKGIKVVRITNNQVRQLFKSHLERMKPFERVFDNFF